MFSKLIKKTNKLLKRMIYRGKYAEEILFWDEYLSNEGEYHNTINNRTDSKKYFSSFPTKLFKEIQSIKKQNPDKKLHLLEVGCGPVSSLAWGVDKKLFKITAIDPLADIYLKLLKKNNINHPVKPKKATGENMIKLFPRNHFDIVYSRNALDHTDSAILTFQNMVKLCKKEGIIFVEGKIREGSRRKWKGLHQHDLVYEKKSIYVYDRFGTKTNLASGLKIKFKYGNLTGSWFTIIFIKQ